MSEKWSLHRERKNPEGSLDSVPAGSPGLPASRAGLAVLTTLALLAGVVGAALALIGDRYLTARTDSDLAAAYHVALQADLRRDAETLESAVDSVTSQIGMTDLILGWNTGEEPAGSGQLMDGFRDLRAAPSIHFIRDTFEDLKLTGRGHLVGNPRLREALARYYREAEATGSTGSEALGEYERWMEAHLNRGAWIYFIGEHPGRGGPPVDFRGTLNALQEAGLPTAVRAARRGLMQYRGHLRALQEHNTHALSLVREELRD